MRIMYKIPASDYLLFLSGILLQARIIERSVYRMPPAYTNIFSLMEDFLLLTSKEFWLFDSMHEPRKRRNRSVSVDKVLLQSGGRGGAASVTYSLLRLRLAHVTQPS